MNAESGSDLLWLQSVPFQFSFITCFVVLNGLLRALDEDEANELLKDEL